MTKHSMRPSRRATLLGGLAILGAGGLTSITLPAFAVGPGPASVQLRTLNGNWVGAPGDNAVTAYATYPGSAETFEMIPLGGNNQLEDGAQVALKARTGLFVCAEGGGGFTVTANREVVGPWETFTLLRAAGPGIFSEGDVITLRTRNGPLLYANGGGGGEILGSGQDGEAWAAFTALTPRRRHVRMEFIRVTCYNTEDVTGADEFYATATAKDRFDLENKTSLSQPLSINDGQTKDFPFAPAERVFFDGDVQAASTIAVAAKFYDQDASNDWSSTYTNLANSVAAGLTALGGPGVAAGAVLKILTAATEALFRLDKDDLLGEYKKDWSVADLPFGTTYEPIPFADPSGGGRGWSTWSYNVQMAITVS